MYLSILFFLMFQILGNSFLIRPLSPSDDLEEYRALFLRCDNVLVKGLAEQDERLQRIGRSYVSNAFQTDLSTFETVQDIFFQSKGQFWVLIDADKNLIIGSIALEDKLPGQDRTQGELRRMCISPDYRRRGLGNMLVQHLLSYAAENNFQRVFLTTPSSNTSAIEMYLKAGFLFVKSVSVECGEEGELEISTFSLELASL
jgi:ribosomal protein S18 acetylase RimI-like enzyme